MKIRRDGVLETQPVSGSVTVVASPALTDAELRATPVPVAVDQVGLSDAELRATPVPVEAQDSGEREYTHVVATVTANGDTTVYTPAPGKALRLRWLYAINDPTSASAPLIKIKLGSSEIYRAWAISKRQLKTGAVDAPLVVNLTGGGNVAFTAIIEEV